MHFVSIHVVHPYSSTDPTTACCILSNRSVFHITYITEFGYYKSGEARHLEWRWLLLVYNSCTLFYLHSPRGQCLPLPPLSYAARIWLGQVYLQEALYINITFSRSDIASEACELVYSFLRTPPRNNSYTSTYLISQRPSK